MYIGIDLGTSGVKTILIDHNQKILSVAHTILDVYSPKDGFNEQDPNDWIVATKNCLAQLQKQQPTEFSATISIGISGHMHGATLIDKEGKVIRPCILWNDTRSHAECIEFEDQEFDVRAISGNITMPGFTAPKINWVKNKEPENFKRVNKVLLPKDYLRFYLTGEFFSEMSDASGTLWMDIKKRKWSESLLAASFLTKENMPVLVEGNEEAGILKNSLKDKFKFTNNVIVVGGAGDNAASAIGLGVVEDNQSFISLGTSGVFFTPTSSFLSNTNDAVHSFCHCLPNKWHLMSVMLSASNCLDWVCSITGDSIDKAIKNAENFTLSLKDISNSPYFLPYMSGERTPHNDPHVRGSFHYLKTTTNKAAIQYAVLEGISFGILDCVNSIQSIHKNFDDVFMVGGGSQSLFWLKLLSSIINRKLSVCEQSEFGAALGVSRLAMFVDKNIANKNTIIKKINIKKSFFPDNEKINILEQRYNVWRNIYSSTKKISASFL
jgi:xylulokinase